MDEVELDMLRETCSELLIKKRDSVEVYEVLAGTSTIFLFLECCVALQLSDFVRPTTRAGLDLR